MGVQSRRNNRTGHDSAPGRRLGWTGPRKKPVSGTGPSQVRLISARPLEWLNRHMRDSTFTETALHRTCMRTSMPRGAPLTKPYSRADSIRATVSPCCRAAFKQASRVMLTPALDPPKPPQPPEPPKSPYRMTLTGSFCRRQVLQAGTGETQDYGGQPIVVRHISAGIVNIVGRLIMAAQQGVRQALANRPVRGRQGVAALQCLRIGLDAGLLLLAGIAFIILGSMTMARADTLTGTALIRERIALPPGAVFEAVIEDVSRADAPAARLAATVIADMGQPPIAFSIDYDPTALDPRAIYALRATIRHEERLLFTTDTITRVLEDVGEGRGPQSVEVILKMVPQDSTGDAGPALGAHGLRLPASFLGTLPCTDCEGIRHHLDLWPDQHYHLRREWLGRAEGTLRRDEIGRWYADPVRGAIVLFGASEMPLFWQVKGPDRLRQTDMAGNPIVSDLPLELESDGTLAPTELQGVFLLGRMTYMADAAVFEECLSGVRYPVAQEGDYLALERAYLDAAPAPGAPVVVHVEGGLAPRPSMEGAPRTSLIVERFIAARPDDACPGFDPQASLTDTYWRIDTLMAEAALSQPNRREPHIVMQSGPDRRFRATVGCNQIIGRYEVEGDDLTFGAAASTLMACPPPLDVNERRLRDVLSLTRKIRIEGQRLQLLDNDGMTLAELGAVYLR